MNKTISRLLLALPCCSTTATAQVIIAGPLTAVPVNNPWMLFTLVILLVGTALVMFRHKHARFVSICLLTAAAAMTTWLVPDLKAQILSSFTSASGETLPIPVSYDAGNQRFEAADFRNDSNATLRILQIELPNFAQCFSGGLVPLAPQPPQVVTLCGEAQLLHENASCRVDVHSVCEDLALAATATISINPLSLLFIENGTGVVTLTNDGASPVPAENLVATIPGGSNVSVQSTTCGASLAIGASCTITFTSATQEGPTTVPLAGDNTNTVDLDITVVAAPQISITAPIQQSRTVPVSGLSLSLELTNDAGSILNANAITVSNNAACPALLVDDSDCASVAPGASCTLQLTSNTPYAPCTITISGSNTANSPTALLAFSHLGGLVFEEAGGNGKVVIDVAQEFTGTFTGVFSNVAGAASLDDGIANTNALVVDASCSGDPANCAAQQCRNIGAEWHLPARNELTAVQGAMCSNLAVPCNFGGFSSAIYWSSSQVDLLNAWSISYPGGVGIFGSKNTIRPVRCVRTF